MGERDVRSAAIAAALIVCGVLAPAAAAKAATPVFSTFFTQGNGAAAWSEGADAPGDNDGQSVKLTVPDPSSYAGLVLSNFSPTPPSTAPAFSFLSSVSGPSGGAPRLVLRFSNGDTAELAPASWTAGQWTRLSGGAVDWFDAGAGGCPALNDVSYAQALACSTGSGASITDVYLLADDTSSASGFVQYVDDISYGGATVTTGEAAVKGATTGLLVGQAIVSARTGRGTIPAVCSLPAAAKCRVDLTLTAVATFKGSSGNVKLTKVVRIGTITGTLRGGGNIGTLNVELNADGRNALRKALRHGAAIRASAAGTYIRGLPKYHQSGLSLEPS
jgi:hypothetical protein